MYRELLTRARGVSARSRLVSPICHFPLSVGSGDPTNSCGDRGFEIRHGIAALSRADRAVRTYRFFCAKPRITDHFRRESFARAGISFRGASLAFHAIEFSGESRIRRFVKVKSGPHVQLFSQLQGFPA